MKRWRNNIISNFKSYLALGPEAGRHFSLQECTSKPPSVPLCSASLSPRKTHSDTNTHISVSHLSMSAHSSISRCFCVCAQLTLGCRANHSSICVSNSQESKVSSVSPRKLLCPKRSWCHTETCSVRVSSWEWLTTYYTEGQRQIRAFKSISNLHLSHQSQYKSLWGRHECPLTLRFSLNTGLVVLLLMLVFLLLWRDLSGRRYVLT